MTLTIRGGKHPSNAVLPNLTCPSEVATAVQLRQSMSHRMRLVPEWDELLVLRRVRLELIVTHRIDRD